MTEQLAPTWLVLAREQIGVAEIKGPLDNEKIIQFSRDAGINWIDDDETPWCACFVGAMLKRAGIKGTGSALARSYLNWGMPIHEPKPGAIVVFRRGSNPAQGHVAFFVSKGKGGNIWVVGGNQSNRVCIEQYDEDLVIEYRWPSATDHMAVKAAVAKAEAAAVVPPVPAESPETWATTVTEAAPTVPVVTPPPIRETITHLKERGSRTIQSTEMTSWLARLSGILATVIAMIQGFVDSLRDLTPFVAIAIVGAVLIIIALQWRIQEARADDEINRFKPND